MNDKLFITVTPTVFNDLLLRDLLQPIAFHLSRFEHISPTPIYGITVIRRKLSSEIVLRVLLKDGEMIP
jgi:hypothetical protein